MQALAEEDRQQVHTSGKKCKSDEIFPKGDISKQM
jgi:hypothetical protein